MKKYSPIAAAIVMLLFVLGNSNCSKSNNSSAPTLHVQLQTSATLGKYLADKKGRALYFFVSDVNGKSNCTGSCELNWPILNDSNLTAAEVGAGLNLSDFASIQSAEGMQLTYKGWPLYTFAPAGVQEAAGQITGDGGGNQNFYVAKPDYTIMIGNGQLHGADGNDYTSTYTIGTGDTRYFTDAWGATLYTFKIDSANHNKFTKSDFSNNATFPIYDTTTVVVPSALTASLFTTTAVFGKSQLTYNGYPLYYFGSDSSRRGNTKGVSIGAGKWPVAAATTPPAPHP